MGNDDEVGGSSPSGRSQPPRRISRSTSLGKSQEAAIAAESATKELLARSRSLFLHDVERQLTKKELYSLDEEFARTRRNRSPFVWLSVLIFVSVMVVVAIVVTSEIQRHSQEVPVNISAFADVNLRDLLDRAKQLELQMQNARRNLSDLQSAEAARIQDARSNANQQIQVVEAELLSPDQKKEKEAVIRQVFAGHVAAIRASFAPRIDEANKSIADIQKQLDHYDTRQVEEARKQEAILNNQQRIFDMQMNKTVGYYEDHIRQLTDQFTSQLQSTKYNNDQLVDALKRSHAAEVATLIATYNPTFTSPEITSILSRPITAARVAPDSFSGVVVAHGIADGGGLSALKTRVQEFETVLTRLQRIPYKNSVPAALDTLQGLSRAIVSNYQQMANGLASTVTDESRLIGAYDYALSSLINNSRENGYIIDARDTSKIVVFIAPIYTVRDGESAFVFRKDDEPIGTISLHLTSGGVEGTLVSLAKSAVPMEPFDKILLDVKR